MRKINEIIVHCTATHEGREVAIADIERWHKARGWSGCGYHLVVGLDGKVQLGRPIEKVGAHCSNHNASSIGVCYVGGLDKAGMPKDTRTPEQKIALRAVVETLKAVFKLTKNDVHGHNEFANKACPCFLITNL